MSRITLGRSSISQCASAVRLPSRCVSIRKYSRPRSWPSRSGWLLVYAIVPRTEVWSRCRSAMRVRPSGRRARESAVAQVAQRLLDLLARVHDEGPVLHHGFMQRPPREQQHARRFARDDAHFLARTEHARRVRPQWFLRTGCADADGTFVRVHERVVARGDRVTELRTRV